jgi:hypothetical protein
MSTSRQIRTMAWSRQFCWLRVRLLQTWGGAIRLNGSSADVGNDARACLESIGFVSFAGAADSVEHVQQLSDRSDGKRNRAQVVGIEFEIGGGHRHVPFHGRTDPNDTTPPNVRLLGDACQRQGPPAKRMTGINNGDHLLGSRRHADRGIALVEVSQHRDCPPSRSAPA